MALQAEGWFLLFAAGTVDHGEDDLPEISWLHRLRPFVVLPPPRIARPSPSGPVVRAPDRTAETPWHIPGEAGRAVRIAFDIAEKVGARIRLIDTERPGADEPLVRRWVREADLLPMLVAPDGRRLGGLGSFVPRRLKEFLRPARA